MNVPKTSLSRTCTEWQAELAEIKQVLEVMARRFCGAHENAVELSQETLRQLALRTDRPHSQEDLHRLLFATMHRLYLSRLAEKSGTGA